MVLRFRKRLRLSPCKATPLTTMMMLKMVIRAMIFTGDNDDGDDGFYYHGDDGEDEQEEERSKRIRNFMISTSIIVIVNLVIPLLSLSLLR